MTKLPHFFENESSEMRLAARAAMAAGEIISAGYQKVHEIDSKGVGDLVSQVDFEADKIATEILTSESSLPIMSEELSPETDDAGQEMWVVDPLDGTTAYLMAAGPRFSSVLISICDGGQPILGITFFPLTGEWFYASRGTGAFKDGKVLKIASEAYQLKEVWIEMNQYGDEKFETDFFSSARTSLRSPRGARIVTSSFPHSGVAMRIAEQQSGLCAAIHDNNPANVKQGAWDIAANQVIFEEAGGFFLNPQLKVTSPFVAEPIIVSPSRQLAEQISNCIRQESR